MQTVIVPICKNKKGDQWFPLRNFHIEQIFLLVRMQLLNHVDTQTVKQFKH